MYDKLNFAQDMNGVVWAHAADAAPKPILAPGHEYFNLFAASALLYNVNKNTSTFLHKLLEMADNRNDPDLAVICEQLLANLNIATRCAEEGLSEVFRN